MNIVDVLKKSFLTLNVVFSFSFIPNFINISLFGTSSEADSFVIKEQNSQNMNILVNSTVKFDENIGGGDINVVDGMVLVAESGISGTTLDIEKAENAGQISVYEVREGDTISQIAAMFEVSVNTIRWANDLEGTIQPGQKLVILPVTGLTHTVKSGGTIADVAEIYEADVTEIALFNGLDENVQLQPGDEIIVPHVDHGGSQNSKSNNKFVSTGKTQSVSPGYYTNPVPGGIITQELHGYNGVDIAAAYNTPILAAAAGQVITSKQGGWNGGYGNYVVISHNNGTQTLYSHNSSNIVYVGQYVEKGEVIGYMGSTGRSTGNHLHFETRGAQNVLNSCSLGSVCR
jgi:LysM repeat protein